MHRLKNLTDSGIIDEFFLGFGRVSLRNLIKTRPQKELLSYQNRLESLQIKFDHFRYYIDLLHFDKYPRSITKLSFSGGIFSNPVPSTSLDYFKNLKVLDLNFHKDSSAGFINSLLCLIPKVPNLERLTLLAPLEALPGLKESFRSLKALTMLKHVRIHACNLVFPHSRVLLKVLMKLSLRSLYLNVRIEDPKELSLTLTLLERLTQLETLKLHIYHKNTLESSAIEEILEKVDKLDDLKHLSLTVNTQTLGKEDSEETIQLPLSNLFMKSIPLESFRIESNHVNISNEAFLDLFKSLQKQATSLKKIKLAIGEVFLDKKEFKRFLKLLQKIHKHIRVLKLSMLGIYNKSHFTEIAETVQTMKYLRSFGLGKFYMQVTQTAFWKGVKKILYKHGLVKFKCDASKDFREKILAFARSRSGINWSTLRKKNPALVKIPDSISFNGEDGWEN